MYDDVVRSLRKMIKAHKEIYGGSTEESVTIEQAADAIEELIEDRDAAYSAGHQIANKLPVWIPVTERLPPYGDRILVTDKTGVWEGYLSYSRGFMRNTGMTIKDIYDVEVTHWMPLPEPPKEET